MVTAIIRPTTSSPRTGRTLWHAERDLIWTPRGTAPLAIAGAVTLGPAVFGTGRRLEGAATNLVTNPSFEVSTTGWAVNNLTITRDPAAAVFGDYGARLQATAVDAGHYADFGSMAVNAGDLVTVSVFARKGTGADWVRFGEANDAVAHVAWFNIATGVAGSTTGTVDTATIEDVGGGLYRLAVSATRASTGNASVFYSIETSDGGTGFNASGTEHHFIDGAQCEVHPCVTAYTDGARGSGFAWSGTPHASTSTRTAAVIEAPAATISPLAGASAAWLRPWWSGAAVDEHVLWHWRAGTDEEMLLRHVSGEWRLEASGSGVSTGVAVPATHQAGEPVFVWAAWSPDRVVVGSGANDATAARSGAIPSGSATLRLGERADTPGASLDSVLDTLIGFQRARSAAEMRALARRTTRFQPGMPA